MLFNSAVFIFAFLPVTLFVFHVLGKYNFYNSAIIWLVCASLFFYGWWNPAYLFLILGSMLLNYGVGLSLSKTPRKGILALGVTANLALLGYFKYANFFVENLNALLQDSLHLETVILPLAISFFTFQQIAYLVDAYRGEAKEYRLLHYALFVTFFPQLIAGPIVHHKEMMPQFAKEFIGRINAMHLAIGGTVFAIGLFKKVVLADGIAVYATPIFSAAEAGVELTFFEAWGGALAYTLQLYFDFSGYSDMAIGLAAMFGIRLPLNFNSPYKATNIIDFWRRWHMTLSRFLRDYLYIPLGGNRKGPTRRNINIMLTMLLGGLWHGAGWTFVLWGGLHGLFLLINHAWRRLRPLSLGGPIITTISWGLTMAAVVIAWVPFRAETMTGTLSMLSAMGGVNGLSLPADFELVIPGLLFDGMFHNGLWINAHLPVLLIFLLGGIAVSMPNTQQLLNLPGAGAPKRQVLVWRPTAAWAVLTAAIFLFAVMRLDRVSEFIYFQF